jgi:hypothetical protein
MHHRADIAHAAWVSTWHIQNAYHYKNSFFNNQPLIW